jgi:hypothetical protein
MVDLTLWDLEQGRALRDEALERVHNPPWASFANLALRAVAGRQQVVTSDDVWAELERIGIPEPGEKRAIGPVMVAGVRAGWIEPLGYTTGTNPKHHADVMRTYRSRVYGR